ncbi:hypothetical protein CDAR_533461 [Caerostris darwini]|uniref:Uncharacterized protein n=1 Tax=Caerostris darwini TaxID=1538125 RepID=A0AAV4S9D7_9ARAC|nr:hypothetical protein CDAR_533461 [Caerostris darwini]
MIPARGRVAATFRKELKSCPGVRLLLMQQAGVSTPKTNLIKSLSPEMCFSLSFPFSLLIVSNSIVARGPMKHREPPRREVGAAPCRVPPSNLRHVRASDAPVAT